MSDQTGTIFNEQQPTEQSTQTVQPPAGEAPAQQTAPVDPYTDLLGTIKTDDGRMKYATVSDALNSIPHAQAHISTLETELAQTKAELTKRATVQESIQQLAQPQAQESPTPQGLGEQEVTRLFNQQFQQVEAQKLASANQQSVANTLREWFNDNAEGVYESKAKELGIDPVFLNDLSAKSPQAVLAYFDKPKTAPQRMQGTVNTAALSAVQPQQPRKGVMFGASTEDLLGAWRQSKPESN
jgi:hypothetical protein